MGRDGGRDGGREGGRVYWHEVNCWRYSILRLTQASLFFPLPPSFPPSLQTSLSGAEIDRVVDAFMEDGASTMQYLIDADYTEDDLVRARPPSLPPSLLLFTPFCQRPSLSFMLPTLTCSICRAVLSLSGWSGCDPRQGSKGRLPRNCQVPRAFHSHVRRKRGKEGGREGHTRA